jgi:hypothetical protein
VATIIASLRYSSADGMGNEVDRAPLPESTCIQGQAWNMQIEARAVVRCHSLVRAMSGRYLYSIFVNCTNLMTSMHTWTSMHTRTACISAAALAKKFEAGNSRALHAERCAIFIQ